MKATLSLTHARPDYFIKDLHEQPQMLTYRTRSHMHGPRSRGDLDQESHTTSEGNHESRHTVEALGGVIAAHRNNGARSAGRRGGGFASSRLRGGC